MDSEYANIPKFLNNEICPRMNLKNKIKQAHGDYLLKISNEAAHCENFTKRLSSVKKNINNLLRKQKGSKNSLKDIHNISNSLFGLFEDIKRLRFPTNDFKLEIEIINKYIIVVLDDYLKSSYHKKCASIGETILACYLDLFITFTTRKTPKKINVKPPFLVNPLTNSPLELDIMLDEFRLAFEFQGEHHYTDNKVRGKDAFKLIECSKNKRILIPVNISQLSSVELQNLISNSIKDHLGLQCILTNMNTSTSLNQITNNQLLKFSKVVQRIYLSSVIFKEALSWLDLESKNYINGRLQNGNQFSASKPAPRGVAISGDLDIKEIYKRLPLITKLRKK